LYQLRFGQRRNGHISGKERLKNSLFCRIPLLLFRKPPQEFIQEAITKQNTSSGWKIVFSVSVSAPQGRVKPIWLWLTPLSEVLTKKRKKLILTRPVVEAGENLGFLPGDLSQKISPYLRPLYDAIEDLLPPELVLKMEDSRMIEVAPLAYMRGRSLKNCYVVLDEAQNTTKTQMKMFLTRIGENARVVVTGDPSQSDLPGSKTSGLLHAQRVLSDIQDISFTHFKRRDVVRHPLVKKIIEAYEQE
jgi:phosphate starvation-inducible PhoH-like protein